MTDSDVLLFDLKKLLGRLETHIGGRSAESNIRYNFIHRPLSDVFLVYSDTRATGTNSGTPSRSLVLKVTHLMSC